MSWNYYRQTSKYRAVKEVITKYIEENNGYFSGLTSWVNQAIRFKEDFLDKMHTPDDEQLSILVREFCKHLRATYSITDSSTLKRDLLNIVGKDPIEQQYIDLARQHTGRNYGR